MKVWRKGGGDGRSEIRVRSEEVEVDECVMEYVRNGFGRHCECKQECVFRREEKERWASVVPNDG